MASMRVARGQSRCAVTACVASACLQVRRAAVLASKLGQRLGVLAWDATASHGRE